MHCARTQTEADDTLFSNRVGVIPRQVDHFCTSVSGILIISKHIVVHMKIGEVKSSFL